jgi:hypothetical protein
MSTFRAPSKRREAVREEITCKTEPENSVTYRGLTGSIWFVITVALRTSSERATVEVVEIGIL